MLENVSDHPSLNDVCYAGVAVGSGLQVLVAFINVGTYYLVGIPLGVLFGFKLKLGTLVRSARRTMGIHSIYYISTNDGNSLYFILS